MQNILPSFSPCLRCYILLSPAEMNKNNVLGFVLTWIHLPQVYLSGSCKENKIKGAV